MAAALPIGCRMKAGWSRPQLQAWRPHPGGLCLGAGSPQSPRRRTFVVGGIGAQGFQIRAGRPLERLRFSSQTGEAQPKSGLLILRKTSRPAGHTISASLPAALVTGARSPAAASWLAKLDHHSGGSDLAKRAAAFSLVAAGAKRRIKRSRCCPSGRLLSVMSYDSRPARWAVIHDHCVSRSSVPQSRAGSRAATAAASRALASAGVLHPRCQQAEAKNKGDVSRSAAKTMLREDRGFTGRDRASSCYRRRS